MTLKTPMTPGRKKYRYRCLIGFLDNTVILGEMSKDGLLYWFDAPDIESLLNKAYKTKDKYGWYHNESRDRYVAEIEGDGTISVNPSFVDIFATDRIYETE